MQTGRKFLYAKARAEGKNITEAAIAAGCPEKTAAQAGSRYEKDPDVIAFWKRSGVDIETLPRRNREKKKPAKPVREKIQRPVVDEKPADDRPDFDPLDMAIPAQPDGDPLKFLETVMNHVETDPRLRVDAAKALASFKVAKPGERGKKGEAEDRAKKAANRFAPVAAPGLKVVK